MSFFTNKHVIAAMIVTPVLAVAGWYAVDLLVKERPQTAQPGASYPLVAKSNCRYTSGVCTLVNSNFKSSLVVVRQNGRDVLRLTASHTLQDAKVGFSAASDQPPAAPQTMQSSDAEQKVWSIELPVAATEKNKLVIALRANDAHYYAETTMGFAEYKTSFNKDFTQN